MESYSEWMCLGNKTDGTEDWGLLLTVTELQASSRMNWNKTSPSFPLPLD